MKREEFLNTLFENIPDYTKEEQEEIRQYYEELICDGVEAGLDEEEVISRLESPENIAFSLKKEYKEERKAEVSVVCDSSDDYTSSQPVAHAVISARDRGIALEPSEDGRVHVHCEKDEIDEIVCYEKEGMFFFSHRSKRRMHFFGGFSRVDSTIKVQIPESVMQAELSTTNGGIRISEISKPEMVKAHTTNGGITCNDVRASHVELISSNASVKCEDTKVQTICMESTNGALRLKDVQADEKLAAHTTNGSIHFEEIDAKDIQLKTSNASIKGTLRGKGTEYAIESGTSNGKNSLPAKWNQSDSAAKRLSVHTSNANIKVAFEEM